jgi:iron complex outermembrane receptor protein
MERPSFFVTGWEHCPLLYVFWPKSGQKGQELRTSILALAAGGALALASPAQAQLVLAASNTQSVFDLSIEQLARLEITSVTKSAQPLSGAAAAVYVIQGDDITRAGATSVPEMLRLAPNLEVMQTAPADYQITARGLNGNTAAQNFPNKLLLLIDGRSAYSPLYSGIFWDAQGVLPENVERIEVISGPGGTLWGANAVNGVINITTRSSAQTQGLSLTLGGGDSYSQASLQYGGMANANVSYRFYLRSFYQSAFNTLAGLDAGDGWTKPQGGFRVDWDGGADRLTVSGDIYNGVVGAGAAADQKMAGGNLTARWTRQLADNGSLQLLAYYDQVQGSSVDGGGLHVDTYNIEAQHNFMLGSWNSIVWGLGNRIHKYELTDLVAPTGSLLWRPNARTQNLFNVFVQDTIALSDSLSLTLGVKLENDPYESWTPMPSGRLSWTVSEDHMLWGAVSRSARTPTPFDVDVVQELGGMTFLTGNPNFQPEQITAYELGYRGQVFSDLNLSVSLFHNVFEGLRSVEITPVTLLPLMWGNGLEGSVQGAEIWGTWEMLDWWRLSAGVNYQEVDLNFIPGASGLLGVAQAGNSPEQKASLRSSMNLTDALTLDANMRYVGMLRDPRVPGYVEAGARIGWAVTDAWSLSLTGYNLLHNAHQEFAPGDAIPRSVYLETRLSL